MQQINQKQQKANGLHKAVKARSTEVRIVPAKTTPRPDKVEVSEIEKEIISITLVGIGAKQMIVQNFHEKGIYQMEEDRRMNEEQKREKKKAGRPPVIPEERWQLARILDEKGRDCFEARWVKAALVTASKYPDVGIKSTQLRGAIFVLGDLLPISFTGRKSTKDFIGKIRGMGVNRPVMRRDLTRVGNFPNKKPDLRYRPGYDNWSLDIMIEYEPQLITLAGLHHLLRRAGSSVGLGEWRPEKSPAGIYGRFDIKTS
jgi:hypothetical protein